ncbi:hypothetical protein TH468_18070 [Thalassospira sp. MCCC 1A03138]|nr:hypothetical protein TH468_18070 [Thalassospira sp. MCCC 1A03138]
MGGKTNMRKPRERGIGIHVWDRLRANIFEVRDLSGFDNLLNVMERSMTAQRRLRHSVLTCKPGSEMFMKIIFRLQILFSHRMVWG